MGYNKEDIAAALQKQNIDPETGQDIRKAQIEQALQRQGIDPTGGLIGQLKSKGPIGYMGALTKGAAMAPVRTAEIGAAGGQELQRLMLNIPGAKRLGAKIVSHWTGRDTSPSAIRPTPVISTQTAPGAIGKAVGDITAYGAPIGEAGEVGGAIAKGSKVLEKFLPGAFRTATGAGLGAALASPGHRTSGAAQMGLASTIPELAGAGLKYRGSALDFLKRLSPKAYASNMMKNLPATRNAEGVLNDLGGGLTPEQNAKSLASKVRSSKEARTKYFSGEYNDLIKRAGPESLYDEPKPAAKGSYRILQNWKKSPIDTYLPSIKRAHEDFTDMPTFGNAHKLQSVLGDESRSVFKNPFSNLQDKATAQGWRENQQKLLNDMDNHLSKVDPTGGLSNEYKDLGEKYLHNVVPYKNKYITKIATGKITNPRNLTTVFKNPESDIAKVVNDLGPNVHDQIIYNELYHRNPTAKNILNNYGKLEEKGLRSYVSSKLARQADELKTTHAQDEFKKNIGNKSTPKNIIKAGDRLEKQGLLQQLNPSLQEQLDILKTKYTRATWAKRGAGILGATYLAKKLLPGHLAQQITL